ncbi:L-lysine 6-transaminase [Gemmatimonadota bacterium]
MPHITPSDVHAILAKHMLVDGYPIVLDIENSTPFILRDAAAGKEYLDFFTYFASSPFGNNHPKMLDPGFIGRLGRVAVNKVSNSDIYTVEMAELVAAMDRVVIPDYLPHLFFVSGGALAVENALKVAFDWKVQKNLAAGRGEKGSKIIHFRHAFHGRTGYTLSLTNTADPRKYQYFPLFDWPRIDPPVLLFPVDEEVAMRNDGTALAAVEQAFTDNRDEIAAVLIEPIQAEGGDNHVTDRFLQGLKELCDRHEAIFILDEVQTGMGLTGTMWAHQGQDVIPDIIAFGKKTQVCGIMAGPKIDEVERNCFVESSRINSTWGGNLVDMVRFTRIIEIMEEDNLVENARVVGEYLLARLGELASEFGKVSNVRGRGLLCAFDLPDEASRDACLNSCMDNGMLVLGCGTVSVRFRPPLQTTTEHVDQGIDVLRKVLSS